VVSIKPQPLYPQGRSSRKPFNMRVAGAQFWSGLFGEENDILIFSNIS